MKAALVAAVLLAGVAAPPGVEPALTGFSPVSAAREREYEKRMLALAPHPLFRLFLTALIHPKLPVSLLANSRIFVYEPAVGVKAVHKSRPESLLYFDKKTNLLVKSSFKDKQGKRVNFVPLIP